MDLVEPAVLPLKNVSALRDRRGVIYVEFLVVFMPVFFMFLAIVQLSFFYAAKLTVQHAAYMGARAAIVVLDDEPARYEDAPRNCLQGEGGSSDEGLLLTLMNVARTIAGWPMDLNEEINEIDRDTDGNLQLGQVEAESYDPELDQRFEDFKETAGQYRSGNPRLQAIRTAVYVPLLTLAPDPQFIVDRSVRRAIGDSIPRFLFGIVYNLGASSVTFPAAPKHKSSFLTEFGLDSNITTRVTYLFHCSVPGVSYLMCQNIFSLLAGVDVEKLKETGEKILSGKVGIGDIQDLREEVVSAYDNTEINRQQQGVMELRAAENPGWTIALGLAGARFKVLRAEVTLPNQGAAYKYQSEEESESCAEYADPDSGSDSDSQPNFFERIF